MVAVVIIAVVVLLLLVVLLVLLLEVVELLLLFSASVQHHQTHILEMIQSHTQKISLIYKNPIGFSKNRPLVRFFLVVAMSVYLYIYISICPLFM